MDVHGSVTHVTYDYLFFIIVAMADSAFFAFEAFPITSHLNYVCIEFR